MKRFILSCLFICFACSGAEVPTVVDQQPGTKQSKPVQEFALKFIRELVTNYDFDGYALDYCRYLSIDSDFSHVTRKLCQAYIGEGVTNFPDDIFYWKDGQRHAV